MLGRNNRNEALEIGDVALLDATSLREVSGSPVAIGIGSI